MRTYLKFYLFLSLVSVWAQAAFGTVHQSSVPLLEVLHTAQSIANTNSDWSVYRTQGESMEAFYGDHSFIVVQQARIRDLRVGMLVLYRSPNGDCLAHQVVAQHGAWIEAKGHSNQRKDPYFIRPEMIIGSVFMVLHAKSGASASEQALLQTVPIAHCKRF